MAMEDIDDGRVAFRNHTEDKAHSSEPEEWQACVLRRPSILHAGYQAAYRNRVANLDVICGSRSAPRMAPELRKIHPSIDGTANFAGFAADVSLHQRHMM